MMKTYCGILLLLCTPYLLDGQNIGIGTAAPSEKLEVAGRIFTTEGGIVFPDNTVQTTAAYNGDPDLVAAPRDIGFIEFAVAELAGPVDTLGINKLSIIYSCEFPMANESGVVNFQNLVVAKLNDKASQRLLKYVATGIDIPSVTIHFTQEGVSGHEIYYRIKLTDVVVTYLKPSIMPGRAGGYAHTEEIGLSGVEITFHDLASGLCYCWDRQSNTSCSCP